MGVINDFIDSLASVIHTKRKDDEEEKRKRDRERTVFHENEFKKQDPSLIDQAGDFLSDAGQTINTATRPVQDFVSGVAGQAHKALRDVEHIAGDQPLIQLPGLGGPTPVTNIKVRDAFNTIVKPDSTLGQTVRGNLDKVPEAFKKDVARAEEPWRKAQEVEERAKREHRELTPEEQRIVMEPTMNMVIGAVDQGGGPGAPLKEGLKETIEKATGAVKEGVEQVAAHADETLRPFIKTSAGGMEVPSSVLADKTPSSSVTNTFTPSRTYSPTASVKDVLDSESFISKYQSTTAEKPFLDSVLSDVSQGREYTTNLKDVNTAAEKIVRKLRTNPSYSEESIGDMLRGNIIAKDSADAITMLQELSQKVKVQSVDDYINNPSAWGYQGMNVNIRTPNGNLAEVQIHTPLSMEIQKKLHPLYEKYRNAETIPTSVYEESKKIAQEVTDKYKAGTVTNPLRDVPLVDEARLGSKERKFITSVKEEPTLNPEIRQSVEGMYDQRANKELLATVQKRIDEDPQAAIEHVLSSNTADDEQVAMGIDLLRRANNAGDTRAAVDIVESLAPKLTEAGRTVQAASLLGRLSPEGALLYTQRVLKKAAKRGEQVKKITEKTAEEIKGLAEKANKAVPGSREQEVAAGELAKRINQELPKSAGQKIATLQTIAQLLNPKTTIRNFVGNTGFSAIENIKDVIATPLDMAAGAITGERYKTLPSLTTQLKGYGRGFKEGAIDAIKGIDTSAGVGKFDLAKTSAFATKAEDNIVKKVVYKPIEVLERLTNLTLKAPDRAAYQAAYDESLRQMMKVRKITDVSNVTDEMKAIAHMDGLYRTFQDDTIASKMFGQIKQGLNVGKAFGAGDLILKYPKTPGNILARGIEYSPIGFFSSAINLGKMVLGKEGSQKAFVESTARAITGSTAMVATGAILHQLGIITGRPDTDPDLKALQEKQGFGDYRLNVSALTRFISSGFDKNAAKAQEGDKVISYDWFQPQAINFAMGADIDANKGVNEKSLMGTLFGAAASASNTLVEQPLVSGLSRLFNYGDLPGGVAETLAGAPSSFMPTLLNQVKQLMDNTSRDPQDPDLAKKAVNLVENKIPLVNRNLPGRYDVFGDQAQTYKNDGNNWFNVFFNPSFESKVETTPEGREIMRLYDTTGLSVQAPKLAGNSIQVNGKTKELTGEEKQKYQQYIGVKTREYFKQAMQKQAYKDMTDEEKAKALQNIITDVSVAARIELFGHKPSTIARKQRVKRIMNMDDPLPMINR